MHASLRTALITLAVCLLCITDAIAGEAQRFIILSPNSKLIKGDTDHYSVTIDKLWLTDKPSWLTSLLQSTKDGALEIKATVKTFDGAVVNGELVVDRTRALIDLHSTLNRPLSEPEILISSIPASNDATISIRIGLSKSNRLSDLLGAIDSTKNNLPQDIFSAPAIGYAKAVAAITDQIFALSGTQVPFLAQRSIRSGFVFDSDGNLREHDVIFVVPNDDNDKSLLAWNSDNLSIDQNSGLLRHAGQIVTDHSYAITQVRNAPRPLIKALILDSSAPWAALATSQFLALSELQAKNADQIITAADGYVKSLSDILALLKQEPRFSPYDRAVALVALANQAINQLTQKCQQIHSNIDACGITHIQNYRSTVASLANVGLKGSNDQAMDQMRSAIEKEGAAVAQTIVIRRVK